MNNIRKTLSEELILGNASVIWLQVGITFGVILAFFLVIKFLGNARYKSLKEQARTNLTIGFIVASFARKINIIVATIVSFYFARFHLTLPQTFEDNLIKIFIVFVFIQIFIWLINAINLYSKKLIYDRISKDPATITAANVFTLLAKILIFLLVLLLMLDQLGVNITTLLAGLGVGGIAVALAVQNILGDIFASLTIVLDKPFKVGDLLHINNMWGRIERVGLKNTRIRSSDGNLMIVPNNFLLQNQILNYSELTERRTQLKLAITYDTKPEVLEKLPNLVKEIVESHEVNRFDKMIFQNYGDSALIYELTYYTEMKKLSGTTLDNIRHAVNLEIFKAFNENKIEFAYPTQTLYVNNVNTNIKDKER